MGDWYMRLPDGSEHGPYGFKQIWRRLNDSLPMGTAIKQGGGPWHTPAFTRRVLKALQSEGWYARKSGNDREQGPYTLEQAQTMIETGELPLGTEFRQGKTGNWVYSAVLRTPLEEGELEANDSFASMDEEEKPCRPPPDSVTPTDPINAIFQGWTISVVGSFTIIILAYSLYKLAEIFTNG